MKLGPTAIQDCFEVLGTCFEDNRGTFTKIYQKTVFSRAGVDFDFEEVFFSSSKRHVIRGLHFQLPPHDHAKIVTCISGYALDVIVDLRKGSATYGETASFSLRQGEGRGLLIPRGCAHGFCSLEDNTVIAYFVSSEHSRSHDSGIHWTSAAITWPTKDPNVSARDALLPHLSDFESPFP
ncbi:dTDP-4-dehydrorhamnose 3,5-epimerase family protein [bacterium]|nr:dTDP-4-dehydrorhamnose 3,5-epimerase family protein [bacterium]